MQGADVFAVWAGLPESGVLFEHGMGNLAVKRMASGEEHVGFAYMRRKGATTLYESLSDDMQSLHAGENTAQFR